MEVTVLAITYNRRIIAGTKAPTLGFDCAPDVRFGWRAIYIALAMGVALTLGLSSLAWWGALCLIAVLGFLLRFTALETAGHVATIALMAAAVGAALPVSIGPLAAAALVGCEVYRRLVRD